MKRADVSRAIGPGAINAKKIQEKIGLKVKIIKDANSIEDAKNFIEDVVYPIRIKAIQTNGHEITITAGSNQNKAALIGRNKRRFDELRKVLQDYFHRDLRVI